MSKKPKSEKLPTGIEKRGTTYRAAIMHKGRRFTETLPTLAEAVSWREKTLKSLREDPTYNPEIGASPKKAAERVPLSELIEKYVEYGDKQFKRMTEAHDKGDFANAPRFKRWPKAKSGVLAFLKPDADPERRELVKKRALEIKSHDLMLYVEARRGKGLRDTTIYQEIQIISSCYEMAHALMPDIFSRDDRPQNPVKALSAGRDGSMPKGTTATKTQSRKSDISWDDLAAVFREIPANMRGEIAFLTATGCRRGELCVLRWGDLHYGPDKKPAFFELPTSKSGHPRRIYVNSSDARIALEILGGGQAKDKDTPLTTLHPDTISHIFARAADRAGHGWFRLHDLRRKFIFDAADSGIEAVVVQRLVGHRSLAMTNAYYGPTIGPAALAAHATTSRLEKLGIAPGGDVIDAEPSKK